MRDFEVGVEPNDRRRRGRQSMSDKERAAALFRVWEGLDEMVRQAEHIGDGELVHFLAVVQLLVAEKASGLTAHPALDSADTSRPN